MAQITDFCRTLLLCLCGFLAMGQNGAGNYVIEGRVIGQNGFPVEGATVAIVGTVRGTATDGHGFYRFTSPTQGTVILQASAIGYKTAQKEISQTSSLTQYDFILEEDRAELDEVVIKGQTSNQLRVEELRQSGLNVTAIDMNRYANTTADVNHVLKQVTGVTIRESGGMGSDFVFRINGLAAKIFIDGVPMENFGPAMTLNNIPVNLVDRVEVFKGVVPAHLGSDALGGAVNIITKSKNRKFLDLSYSYGSFNTHQGAIVGNFTEDRTGVTVKANAFYNYSDNNYMMYSNPDFGIVLRKAENGKLVPIEKARRFHDLYQSAMGQVEVGAENKKWTDRFLVGLNYSENINQTQLGADLDVVYGGLWAETKSWMPSIKYLKRNFLLPGLTADAFASYTNTNTYVRDTARHVYDWAGGWREGAISVRDSTNSLYQYINPLARINLNYDLDPERTHSFNLNYNFNSTTQKTTDLYDKPVRGRREALPSSLGRHIVGLTYQGQYFDKRLITTISAKYYGMDASKTIDDQVFGQDFQLVSGSVRKEKNFFGYPSGSVALRYRFTEDIGLKGSVERAYSLPSVAALFGDGQTVLANFDLQPERSDNFNAGFFSRFFFNDEHSISFDGSGFYRKAQNFLMMRGMELGAGVSQFVYFNAPGVTMYGADAEIRYAYKEDFIIRLNGTYDKAFDSWKYTDETNSQVSITYKQQLPNRPWLYGNADISWVKHHLFSKGTRLQLTWLAQYTDWFYLSWAHLGNLNSKDFIPAQMIQTAMITYGWKNNKYNLSMEVRNLLNDLTYDNFRLQKPGRGIFMKARISIM